MAFGVDGNVVDIEITSDIAELGQKEGIKVVMTLISGADVFEAPKLIQGAEVEASAVAAEAHGSFQRPLEDPELAGGIKAKKEDLAGLIRSERQTEMLLPQPSPELPGSIDIQRGRPRGGGRRCGRHWNDMCWVGIGSMKLSDLRG